MIPTHILYITFHANHLSSDAKGIHLHLDFAYSLFKNVNSQCLVSTHTVVLHQSFETHNEIQAFDMCFNGL